MEYYQSVKKYVLATVDCPTKYIKTSGWGKYKLVDNLVECTKSATRGIARVLRDDYHQTQDSELELAIIPLIVKYELIDESGL